jgi:uncharacterized protein (DUF1697 family)
MARYVAFLRGMNVGGHRITMERLRGHLLELGFADVATFLASGNVAFEAPAADPREIERRIEAHLHRALGYEVDTFLRTPTELAEILALQPFPPDDVQAPGHAVHIGFLRDAVSEEAAARVASFSTHRDVLRVHGRELFWLCRGRMTDTEVDWVTLGREVPMRYTVRKSTTVQKIAVRYPAG